MKRIIPFTPKDTTATLYIDRLPPKNALEEVTKYFTGHSLKNVVIPDTFIVRKNGKKDFPGYAFIEFDTVEDMEAAYSSVQNVPICLESIEALFALPAPYFRCMKLYP